MYKKIVVAYDGTSFSDIALREGANLARLCKAELHLVGIVSTATIAVAAGGVPGTVLAGGADLWEMQRTQLEVALEGAARNISEQGLSPVTSIREGIPASEIAACAAEQNADLVVVGHSGKGIIARWFEGSVGAGLLRDLPCNLLIATR